MTRLLFGDLICLALTQCSEWLATNSVRVPASLQFYQLYIKWSALFASDFKENIIKRVTSWSSRELHNQFGWENLSVWSHKVLIYGQTLAQSLCTFGSLIQSAAGVCRECRLFGAAQHSTITRSDCEICANSSVGSGILFEQSTFKQCYPEGFFVSVQATNDRIG